MKNSLRVKIRLLTRAARNRKQSRDGNGAVLRVTTLAIACAVTLFPQASNVPEALTAWEYFDELSAPAGPGLYDFVLDRNVFDKSRGDLADLRLYDGAGREVPYVLRVRRTVSTSQNFAAREFNRSTEGGVAQVSYDLGEKPQETNQLEVDTSGANFRRMADVQGSADGNTWSTLVSQAVLFRFANGGQTVEQRYVPFPVSRFRYLRVRVSRDPEVDRTAPQIETVLIRRSVELQGEMVSYPLRLENRDADRQYGRLASIWRTDLGGRVPVSRMILTVAPGAFERPFQLDTTDGGTSVMLASGELKQDDDTDAKPLTIDFTERRARLLKLIVTDDRNAPLTVKNMVIQAPARQIIFQAGPATARPLRLYYGNGKAQPPRYDLAARLPQQAVLTRLRLGPPQGNPIYRPEPKPFSERAPWLVYVVLAIAAAVLAAILVSIARASKRQNVIA